MSNNNSKENISKSIFHFYKNGERLVSNTLLDDLKLDELRKILNLSQFDLFQIKGSYIPICDENKYILKDVSDDKNEVDILESDLNLLGKKREREASEAWKIYVISLENDKYYVGRTKFEINRIFQHIQGNGASWTSKHKPNHIVEIYNGDNFDEDKTVKRYMANYGIDNVRGGSYSQSELDKSTRDFLLKEIRSSYDYCLRCNKKGHFIKYCNENENKTQVNNSKLITQTDTLYKNMTNEKYIKQIEKPIIKENNYLNNNSKQITVSLDGYDLIINKNQNTSINISDRPKNKFCTRCGRNSHNADNCYAKTRLNSQHSNKIEFNEILRNTSVTYAFNSKNYDSPCFRCGRNTHWISDCYATTDITGNHINDSKSSTGACFRCGSNSHYAYDCYARRDIDGDSLNNYSISYDDYSD